MELTKQVKFLEDSVRASKNTEKELHNLIHKKETSLIEKIEELEERVPKMIDQKIKPVEEKVLMAFGSLDEFEHMLEDLEDRIQEGASIKKEFNPQNEGEGEGDYSEN